MTDTVSVPKLFVDTQSELTTNDTDTAINRDIRTVEKFKIKRDSVFRHLFKYKKYIEICNTNITIKHYDQFGDDKGDYRDSIVINYSAVFKIDDEFWGHNINTIIVLKDYKSIESLRSFLNHRYVLDKYRVFEKYSSESTSSFYKGDFERIKFIDTSDKVRVLDFKKYDIPFLIDAIRSFIKIKK